jgi:hypothetical protein
MMGSGCVLTASAEPGNTASAASTKKRIAGIHLAVLVFRWALINWLPTREFLVATLY